MSPIHNPAATESRVAVRVALAEFRPVTHMTEVAKALPIRRFRQILADETSSAASRGLIEPNEK